MLGPLDNQRVLRQLRNVRHADGFTLMEALVAMVAGIVVTSALFAILDVSLHQSARLEDKVQANQLGRTTMNAIIDELHSACISPEFTPVQSGSTGTELRFINAYGKEAVIPEAQLHEIRWEEETTKKAEKTGTLTDSVYKNSGGTWPTFTFTDATLTRKVKIASNVAQITSSGKTVPIFQYYSYAPGSEGGATTPLSTLEKEPLKVGSEGLTESQAASTASVLVSFNAYPTDGNAALNRTAEFKNQVTFAFSAPPSETPIEDSPCQ